jgi:hypothetical protein
VFVVVAQITTKYKIAGNIAMAAHSSAVLEVQKRNVLDAVLLME